MPKKGHSEEQIIAALRTFVTGAVDNADLQEPEENTGAAAQASARDRDDVCAIRLSSSDDATDARRLEDWCQAVYRLYDEENLKVRSVERNHLRLRQNLRRPLSGRGDLQRRFRYYRNSRDDSAGRWDIGTGR